MPGVGAAVGLGWCWAEAAARAGGEFVESWWSQVLFAVEAKALCFEPGTFV